MSSESYCDATVILQTMGKVINLRLAMTIKLLFILLIKIEALAFSRRNIIKNGMIWSIGTTIYPDKVEAARGAAELDFEYYVRDLIGGNKKEGNVLPSQLPILLPPREIQNPLRSLLLSDDLSIGSLTTDILLEVIVKSTGQNANIMKQKIDDSVNNYRERSAKSFYSREPWITKSVSDQYYFDLTSYAIWRTAADLLPNYVERELFMRQLGRSIYQNLVAKDLIKCKLPSKCSVVESIPCITEILDLYTKSQFCKGYRLGEKLKTGDDPRPLFDEFDDEAITSGVGTDCLISIFEPATLGASLQITGEQSRFSPDYIGPTLSAMWESAGIKASWEAFFVDPVYRPNPKGELTLTILFTRFFLMFAH